MKTIVGSLCLRSLAVTLLCFSLVLVSGCSGCRYNSDDKLAEKEEDKKKKKKKPDFDFNTPILLPGVFPKPKTRQAGKDPKKSPLKSALETLDNPTLRRNRVKPGHWYTANFQAIANNYNADGQLTTYSVDRRNRPIPIPDTNYFVSSDRPVSLPKGEWKNFQTSVYLPTRNKPVSSATIKYSMNRSSSGLPQIEISQPTILMKPFQYHLVVLSNRPDTYKFLDLANCIRMEAQFGDGSLIDPFYQVVYSSSDNPLPLPQHSLNWTTIAYLIWDDYDPALLEPAHQSAMLDWIHHGGQLIISGPDSLDKLQTSFLAKYLPAHFDGSRNLTNRDIEELNKHWTVAAIRNRLQKRVLQISKQVPLLGVIFKPHDDAQFIDGTGEIAIERRIGRGRIAITAFSINAPAVRNWRSFQSFLNGAVLRKPARNFGKSVNEDVVFEWIGDGTSVLDPMIHSTLRYLSRDLSLHGTNKTNFSGSVASQFIFSNVPGNEQVETYAPGDELRLKRRTNVKRSRNLDDDWHYGGYQDTPQSGTGGWNDNSGVSYAARETLKEAAGITPPSSTFVLKMLAAYLIVLVPLNWLLFWMLGRVEYAWIAAPLIAVIGAFFVVKMAALDIGFVRSNTQIGLLEVHADYPRAHLTEYSALYTSLSTRYNVKLDNLTAQSLPFGTVNKNEIFIPQESISQVQIRRKVKKGLDGFQIQSNSTGLLHTEYMLDLDGTMSFFPGSVDVSPLFVNSTNIDLRDAAVLSRDENGNYLFAWIGDLDAGNEFDLTFENIESPGDVWIDNPRFQNTSRSSAKIWSDNVQDATDATLGQIRRFPELGSNWPKFEQLLLQTNPDASASYSQAQFENVYQVVSGSSRISLGRMLDIVLDNLKLAAGEYRLIGATQQRLGRTTFDPQSTRVDQQTLVVAHLKQPRLRIAKPDLNAYEDFVSRSSLDWEIEERELEEQLMEFDPVN